MTGKLMKYELRSMLRLFLPVWGALLLISLLNRLSIRSGAFHEFLGGVPAALLMTAYVLGIIAVAVIALVFVIQRFYNGLLKDEGYLMFTLPVRTSQLIWAKCLAASLLAAITMIVGAFSIGILVYEKGELSGLLRVFFGARVADAAEVAVQTLLRATLVYGIPVLILGVIDTVLRAYLAMAVGQCANRKKVLLSILAYIGIGIVMSGSFTSLLLDFVQRLDSGKLPWLQKWGFEIASVLEGGNAALYPAMIWKAGAVLAGAAVLIELVQILIFFLPTELLLRKKLNLE